MGYTEQEMQKFNFLSLPPPPPPFNVESLESLQIDLSPYEWNFDLDKPGQKYFKNTLKMFLVFFLKALR